MELFDCVDTFRQHFSQTIESYALDALGGFNRPTAIPDVTLHEFLDSITETKIKTFDAVGLGFDLRFSSDTIIGGGLQALGRLVHLTALK